MFSKNCVTHHFACDCREEKFKQLEQENAALRDALASAEVGLKHALMMEPGDPFKRIKAITAALDAVRAARKEAQP